MYKLAMIDDEDTVLYNISKSFDWEKMGFSIAGLFNCTADFFEYLKTDTVDVVLTDINMPDTDGIELCEILKREHPNILVMLLSGYKYFEYAQRAISAGVFSYLLKPINHQMVTEEFERVRTELKKRDALGIYSKKDREQNPVLHKKIYDYLTKKQPQIENSEIFENPAAMVYVTIDEFENFLQNSWKYGVERLYDALERMMESDEILFVPMSRIFGKLSYIAVSKNTDAEKFLNDLNLFGRELCANCLDLLELVVVFENDRIYRGLSSLKDDETRLSYLKSNARWVFELAESGNGNDATKIFHVVTATVDEKSLCDFAVELHKLIMLEITAENIKTYEIYPKTFLPLCAESAANLSEKAATKLAVLLPETVKKLCRYFAENTVNSENDVLKGAIRYIDEHYMEKISLSEVASSVYLSEYHFCRIFKRTVGTNFVDYLNKIRIEKAQTLLVKSDMKINEIYSAVGYSGLKYFHKKFKEITGMTPQEYRKASSNHN